jgi:hypothetical protein
MKKVSVGEIKKKARELAERDKKWHFHILTPECQLNETKDYALVLESVGDAEALVSYSDKPYMGVGEELVKLLHGDDIVKNKKEEKKSPPSPQVEKLLKRAKELTKKGVFWHHHMLFPGCRYNKHGDKWVIVFEDVERGEIIESVTDNEPKSDLQHIEGLFYSQKK